MKKLIINPLNIIFLMFASLFILSNVCCTGKVSNKDKNIIKDTATTQSAQPAVDKGEVIALTDQNFDTKISSGVTLVDFWATWCRPCRLQAPVIEEISKDMAGKVSVCKVDIDECPAVANKYGIQSIPTMIIFKNGSVVGHFVGITAKEDIVSALNKQLK